MQIYLLIKYLSIINQALSKLKNMNHIYKKIKDIRLSKGYTQEEMAAKLKMTQSNYARLERGLTQVTFERLEELAGVFAMSVDAIINFEEQTDFKEDAKYYYTELQKALKKIATLQTEAEERDHDLSDITKIQELENHIKTLKAQLKNKDVEIERITKEKDNVIDLKNQIIEVQKMALEVYKNKPN